MRKPAMQIIEVLILILFFLAATLVLAQRRRSTEAMKVPEGITTYSDYSRRSGQTCPLSTECVVEGRVRKKRVYRLRFIRWKGAVTAGLRIQKSQN